jgi:thioredoxin 1
VPLGYHNNFNNKVSLRPVKNGEVYCEYGRMECSYGDFQVQAGSRRLHSNMVRCAECVPESCRCQFFILICDISNRCGPCKFIGPVFEKLSEENPEAVFVKVDVDDADDVAAKCGIQAMPTFHFYKGGDKVAEMMGADQNKLKTLIAEHK